MVRINFKLISRIFGILLLIESFFMLLSGGVALLYREHDLMAFIISTLATAATGGLLIFKSRTYENHIGKREGFFIVAFAWVLFSLFGMLPFLISGSIDSVTDSFFETMSGFTTTGATVLNNIDELPHGVLFWRSLMQWLGGMGIIVFTIAVLPMFSSGGLQLFNAEVPGLTHDKIRPRIQHTAKRLWAIYLLVTMICATCLWLGPMNMFDAICHAFTTVSTGGCSTKQASIAYWDSAYIEYVVSFFMFFSGTNFTLVYFLLTGKGDRFGKDEEFRWYVSIVLIFTLLFMAAFWFTGQATGLESTFRTSLFQVLTIITTTGFAGINSNYVAWGPIFWVLTLMIMGLGASAGSTSGGIKVIRIMVLLKNTVNELYRQIHPKAIVPVRINKHVLSFDLVSKVLAFIFVYILLSIISILLLVILGLDFSTAIGSVITCIGNVGPGLGETGPAGNFAIVPPLGKWFLSFLMLVGRLELFTVLVLFTPGFWKK